MVDVHYSDPALAALYDLENSWDAGDDFFLDFACETSEPVLDMGCGTGQLAVAMAKMGCQVVAVDLSEAMLDIAKQRKGAEHVVWQQAKAAEFDSDKHFSRVTMTGNVFQVFLTDAKRAASLRNIRNHMQSGALLAFDTRNPAIDWRQRWETTAFTISDDPYCDMSRHVLSATPDQITFETHYRVDDQHFTSHSKLGFTQPDKLRDLLATTSFRLVSIAGDWDGSLFNDASSELMIVKAQAV